MKIVIPWNDEEEYTFLGDKIKISAHKEVYYGHFPDRAPPGVEPGKKYCLKLITPPDKNQLPIPQCREFYDLMDFNGKHIRKIIAKNTAAKRVADELKENGRFVLCPGDLYACVEPIYRPLKNPDQYQPLQRLDIVYQAAIACRELYENSVGDRSIVSHREIKPENLVMDTDDVVKLIDFASIKIDKEEFDCVQNYTAAKLSDTFLTPMSMSNTAPEYLNVEFGEVSCKSDVFSLGMILASFFMLDREQSYVNPLQLWISQYGLNKDKLIKAYRNALKTEKTSYEAWVLLELKKVAIDLQWDPQLDAAMMRRMYGLIIDATRIKAEERIDMETFIRRLEDLIHRNRFSASKVSILLIDRTNLEENISEYYQHASQIHYPCLVAHFSRNDEDLAKEASQTPVLVNSRKALLDCLFSLESSKDLKKDSNYLYGLYAVYCHLYNNRDKYLFHPEICIMTPNKVQRVKKLFLENSWYDLSQMMDSLRELGLHKDIVVFAISREDPGDLYGLGVIWHPIKKALPAVPVTVATSAIKVVPEWKPPAPAFEHESAQGVGKFGNYVKIGNKYFYLIKR